MQDMYLFPIDPPPAPGAGQLEGRHHSAVAPCLLNVENRHRAGTGDA